MADANRDWVLARREFLKTTGAAVVGFRMAEMPAAQRGGSASGQRGLVSGPDDEAEIDSYIAVHPDNTVTTFSGYVELTNFCI